MKQTSDNKYVFNGEVAVHFPGLKGLDMPIVWVFPKLEISLNSGFAQFEVPERELRVLRDLPATMGASPPFRTGNFCIS